MAYPEPAPESNAQPLAVSQWFHVPRPLDDRSLHLRRLSGLILNTDLDDAEKWLALKAVEAAETQGTTKPFFDDLDALSRATAVPVSHLRDLLNGLGQEKYRKAYRGEERDGKRVLLWAPVWSIKGPKLGYTLEVLDPQWWRGVRTLVSPQVIAEIANKGNAVKIDLPRELAGLVVPFCPRPEKISAQQKFSKRAKADSAQQNSGQSDLLPVDGSFSGISAQQKFSAGIDHDRFDEPPQSGSSNPDRSAGIREIVNAQFAKASQPATAAEWLEIDAAIARNPELAASEFQRLFRNKKAHRWPALLASHSRNFIKAKASKEAAAVDLQPKAAAPPPGTIAVPDLQKRLEGKRTPPEPEAQMSDEDKGKRRLETQRALEAAKNYQPPPDEVGPSDPKLLLEMLSPKRSTPPEAGAPDNRERA